MLQLQAKLLGFSGLSPMECILCGPVWKTGFTMPLDMMLTMFKLIMLMCMLQLPTASDSTSRVDRLEASLLNAGQNRAQLEKALASVSADQRPDLVWLIEHMPKSDLISMNANALIENSAIAHQAFQAAPWREEVPLEIYRDAVLPYACINEKRDDWRADFNRRFSPLVSDARSTSEAAAILNNIIFEELEVIYSTKRPRADQSPLESIEAGMASCTGLSILLIDACRSVGVPARFAGTPLWSDGSGNHSWVEIYDSGVWRFTGAAEPVGKELDKAWFASRASAAQEGHPSHAILAVTWRKVPLSFPLPWSPEDRSVRAVDVTSRYATVGSVVAEGMVRVRFRAIDREGVRQAVPLRIHVDGDTDVVKAATRDDRFDTNDHLEVILPEQSRIGVEVLWPSGRQMVDLLVDEGQPLITLREPTAPVRPSDP